MCDREDKVQKGGFPWGYIGECKKISASMPTRPFLEGDTEPLFLDKKVRCFLKLGVLKVVWGRRMETPLTSSVDNLSVYQEKFTFRAIC